MYMHSQFSENPRNATHAGRRNKAVESREMGEACGIASGGLRHAGQWMIYMLTGRLVERIPVFR